MIVADFVGHCRLVFTVEDDARSTLLHVHCAAILIGTFAFARLQELEAVEEDDGAAFVVGHHFDVVGDVSADENCG